MHLNHPKTIPTPHPMLGPWKNCLPRNQPLVPNVLETAALECELTSIHSPFKEVSLCFWIRLGLSASTG